MTDVFKVLGLSSPKSFTCESKEKQDIFWAVSGLTDEGFKSLFKWANSDDDFWKQSVTAEIEFDKYGVNGSAINGIVKSIIIT